jgi:hypothetical protein
MTHGSVFPVSLMRVLVYIWEAAVADSFALTPDPFVAYPSPHSGMKPVSLLQAGADFADGGGFHES